MMRVINNVTSTTTEVVNCLREKKFLVVILPTDCCVMQKAIPLNLFNFDLFFKNKLVVF